MNYAFKMMAVVLALGVLVLQGCQTVGYRNVNINQSFDKEYFALKSNADVCKAASLNTQKTSIWDESPTNSGLREAKRRGIDCSIVKISKSKSNSQSYQKIPLWLNEYSDIRTVTVKIDNEVFKTYAAAKLIRNGNKIKYNSKVILYNELCNVYSNLVVGSRRGRFKVECPSGYGANGSLIALGSGQGSIGEGRDSLGNNVQYNFHDRLNGNISKEEMALALNNLNKSKSKQAINLEPKNNRNSLIDNQKPKINVSINKKGPNVNIFGRVTDDTEVAEVVVNGQAQKIKSDGTFETPFYIPRTGKTIEIVAFDIKGNKASKILKLERGEIQTSDIQQFKSLNPSLKTVKLNSNALALIIGIAKYENTKAALYADSDAKTFYDYATMKLGISSSNIKELINEGADRIDITRAIKTWLLKRTVTDKTDIFIFFAGHGLAANNMKGMYLIPYDGVVPDLLEDSAILRKRLFADIQATKPRSVTVFLDTCYSGGTRNDETLVANLRPLFVTGKQQSIPSNFTVLSAAKGNQTSQSLEEVKHGLFSYYMMLGMEGGADTNNDKKITARELHEYLVDKVERQSQFRQTPELQGDKDRVLVQFN